MNKRIKYIEGTNDILFLIQNFFGTHYLTTRMHASRFANGYILTTMVPSSNIYLHLSSYTKVF